MLQESISILKMEKLKYGDKELFPYEVEIRLFILSLIASLD